MPYELYLKETLNIGTEILFQSASKQNPFAVIFEDDGETGYFYASIVEDNGSTTILDAVHIYTVKDVVDSDKPSELKLGWSLNGQQAILLINDQPHAVFDFENQQGYCKTAFPPVMGNGWCKNDHMWDEAALNCFR